jgi:hypothetical protein
MPGNYQLGDQVEWDWGEGAARGEIAAIHTQNVTKTIDGEEVSREADPGRPAYTVKKEDGGLALVARHEISPLDGGPPHTPRTRQEALETPDYLGETGAPSQGGDAGGNLQEKVGKRDENKRAKERPAGATRVRGRDERAD